MLYIDGHAAPALDQAALSSGGTANRVEVLERKTTAYNLSGSTCLSSAKGTSYKKMPLLITEQRKEETTAMDPGADQAPSIRHRYGPGRAAEALQDQREEIRDWITDLYWAETGIIYRMLRNN